MKWKIQQLLQKRKEQKLNQFLNPYKTPERFFPGFSFFYPNDICLFRHYFSTLQGMRSLGIVAIIMFMSLSAFAKNDDTRTFMVIFKQKELKSLNTTIKNIESQFSSAFKTKSYTGNSDLTLVIEVPTQQIDKCLLGDFLVEVGNNKEFKLQDIAFRVFDLTEGQKEMESFISEYEELQQQRKNDKTAKADLKP